MSFKSHKKNTFSFLWLLPLFAILLIVLSISVLITLQKGADIRSQAAGRISPSPVLTSKSSAKIASGNSLSWDHISKGNDGLLVVYVSYRSPGEKDTTNISSVTFGPVNKKLIKVRRDRSQEYVTELWYVTDPYLGTGKVTVTFAGTPDSVVAGAASYSGVDQYNPIEKTNNAVTGFGISDPTWKNAIGISAFTEAANTVVFSAVTTYSGNANRVSISTSKTTPTLISTTTFGNTIGLGLSSPMAVRSRLLPGNPTFLPEDPKSYFVAFALSSSRSFPWSASSIIISPVGTPSTMMTKKVLAIGYNPVENGKSVADTYFKSAMGGLTGDQVEDKVFNLIRTDFQSLSNNQIQYQVAKKINIRQFQPYPNGFTFTLSSYRNCVWGTSGFKPAECEARKQTFDYAKWFKDNQICEQAAAIGADEIWVMGLPYVMTWETYMVGPNQGYDVNGPNYTFPGCKQHMLVINPTYDRPDLALHDIGHMIEATMRYLTEKWTASDREKYWERFAQTKLYSNIKPTSTYCGNAHYPTNSTSAYAVNSSKVVVSTCPDFKNFPDYDGSTETIGCSTWGCTDEGWQMHWFKSIPHREGTVDMRSSSGKAFSMSKNWWTYILFPDNAIALRSKM